MKAVLDHVGIAVSSLPDALAFYRDTLGLDVEAPEDVASQGVRAHFITAGASTLELLEATSPDSPIARFLSKRGPGMHHVALRVEDIVAALADLRARGIRLIDETPRAGAHGSIVAFVHPSSTHGVLVELIQATVRSAAGTEREPPSPRLRRPRRVKAARRGAPLDRARGALSEVERAGGPADKE
jgi:methylmalonyl-CoA/ethylmalonyl-CoA epimerase